VLKKSQERIWYAGSAVICEPAIIVLELRHWEIAVVAQLRCSTLAVDTHTHAHTQTQKDNTGAVSYRATALLEKF